MASSQLYESIVTGVAYAGAGVLLNGEMVDARLLKKGAVSAGSDYVASVGTIQLIPKLLPSVPITAPYVKPLSSGAVYCIADRFVMGDPNSMLYKFLLQSGASYVADMIV